VKPSKTSSLQSRSPRKFIILVKAGAAIDAVTKELIAAGIEKDDIVVDCGNSLWTDTIRPRARLRQQCNSSARASPAVNWARDLVQA